MVENCALTKNNKLYCVIRLWNKMLKKAFNWKAEISTQGSNSNNFMWL